MCDLRVGYYVGEYFTAYDWDAKKVRRWICVAYDPNVDYFCTTVDDLGPQRLTDISIRAIGRTWHETFEADFHDPALLVFVVQSAQKGNADFGNDPRIAALSESDRQLLSRVYEGSYASFKKWGRLG